MSSFFKSFGKFSTKRENAIKEALINTLGENSREIQYEVKQRGCDMLEVCEVTSSLCTTLEAIFLHGLKDSFLWQTYNVIAGDEERRPEPSFWSPLLIFLHKEVIQQIQTFSQITSEIGQCRAWIRLSLNESLFSSYLNNMRSSSSAFNPYYEKYALIKDSDGLEMAAKIMEGIEAFVQFNLPVNSSLLNHWPDYALQLSGLWTPPLKCTISSGVDIADTLSIETAAAAECVDIPKPAPINTNEAFAQKIENLPNAPSANMTHGGDLSHREHVDILLKAVDEMQMINEEDNEEEESAVSASTSIQAAEGDHNKQKRRRKRSRDQHHEGVVREQSNEEGQGSKTAPVTPTTAHGNSLMNLMQSSWSADEASQSELGTPISEHPLYRRASSTTSTLSYNTLLGKHERDKLQVQIKNNALSLERSISNDEKESGPEKEHEETGSSSTDSRLPFDFEVVPDSGLEKMNVSEIQEMLEQMYKLARQPGLDGQGFLCKSCQHPLGIGYFQVCAFSGNYFCDSCMDLEEMMIPSKIIYNWDFRKYRVSKRAATFLTEFRNQPVLDLELLNPHIYNASGVMAELQSLRICLNFLRAYLYTCEPKSIELLQLQFYGREYLYEHIHLYSINDLAMILRGTLYQQLQKAFKIGESHVLKCPLCSVKGIICDICKSSRVLYPFHIETTYRCEVCGAVFHPQCLNEQQPCPKCERKRKREDLLDLEDLDNTEQEPKSMADN